VPPPRRGELVRLWAEELRAHKTELGLLVTLESGKILEEGKGEVQEMIDIADFAVGLSRQLYGLTIASERPGHRMMETWHPLGPVGVITAFNFPVAVFAWNAAIALVCGDSVLWKPSERTPLSVESCPLPVFSAPFQTAVAFRFIRARKRCAVESGLAPPVTSTASSSPWHPRVGSPPGSALRCAAGARRGRRCRGPGSAQL